MPYQKRHQQSNFFPDCVRALDRIRTYARARANPPSLNAHQLTFGARVGLAIGPFLAGQSKAISCPKFYPVARLHVVILQQPVGWQDIRPFGSAAMHDSRPRAIF